MVTLHHLENSRSQRILWLLEELAIPYGIVIYKRNAKTKLAPRELAQIHPLGKSPVITDGDMTIAESAVIIEYLARTYGGGKLVPSEDADNYWDYTYWMHFVEGTLMPPLVQRLVFEVIKAAPMPFFAKPIAKGIANEVMTNYVGPNIKRHFDLIEDHLDSRRWFMGEELTAVDFHMSFPLEASMARGTISEDYPNIARYVEQIWARDSYQSALQKGGKYDYAK